MKKEKRYLINAIQELSLARNKMAFVSGPRQVGKTTMALTFEKGVDDFAYKNWDQTKVKRDWSKDPELLLTNFDFTNPEKTRLLILDEIHKARGWKSKLKGLYDTHGEFLRFIITGSARLNTYNKGSDSLLGRYFHFRLHPFSAREIHRLDPLGPEDIQNKIFASKPEKHSFDFERLKQLYEYSGFPEPFLAQNKKVYTLWSKGRREKIIREDLRDLSRIHEISQIETLCALLPEKVGTPLSIQSLREDLSVSHDSVTRWLSSLRELYYYFEVRPYSKSISRSLKKDAKIYFYDWNECENEGAKFENFVASHLLKACHYWEDTGEGNFDLHYLRDKDKNEVDFLVVKNRRPWFTVECKLQQRTLDMAYRKFQRQIQCPHIQVVFDRKVFQKVDEMTWILGADYFLGNLV